MAADVLILCYTPLERDPRVLRQVHALYGCCRLTVVGHGPAPALPDVPDVEWIALPAPAPWTLARRVANGLLLPLGVDQRPHIIPAHHALPQLAGRRFAAVLANDLDTLPFAFRLAAGAPVIWDAHEYYLDDQPPTWRWRLARLPYLRRVARRWIPRCRAVMTVSPGIAERYAREFGIRPVLVRNLPKAATLEPGQTPAPPHPVRLVHHGGMAASRSYATLIETATLLGDGYTLDLLVVPADGHAWDELRRRTASAGNVRLLPPVPMPEIPARLNAAYDIGIHILPPASFNDRHALPNKLFEFVQARLAVVTGPSPEMAAVVRQHGLGAVAEGFSAAQAATAVRSLDRARIAACKQAAHAAATILHDGEARHAIRRVVTEAVQGAA